MKQKTKNKLKDRKYRQKFVSKIKKKNNNRLKKIYCENCGSANTYSTKSELICRKCGYRKQTNGTKMYFM